MPPEAARGAVPCLLIALVLTAAALAAAGCGGGSEPAAGGDGGVEQGSPDAGAAGDGAHSSSADGDGGSDPGDSGDAGTAGDSGGGSSDDGAVSRENPGFAGTAFDSSRNDALADAEPLDAVTWVVAPSAGGGALEAKGVLRDGATLFNPMVDGEGAGFIVYFTGVPEPLVLLLPDLGPMQIWETDHTVAAMEHEFEGDSFEFRAYSPLFMDVGPSDLELRVFGYDASGADALLAVQPISVP